ncbi:MAG TPA: zf-HC2 domain-containing protein [Actinomycetes bacterium]|nr:zf-HC2 domain-containing protein [Actinomycetes bacterium]
MNCDFRHADAAYVLGSLSPTEHRAFEMHLATCQDCGRSVQELAGLPGLLSKVSTTDLSNAAESVQPPSSLLPSLISRVRRDRRRHGWLVAGVAAAAACLLGVSVFGLMQNSNETPVVASSSFADVQTMTPLGDVPIQATARLTDRPWGTHIKVRCEYLADYGQQNPSFALVVIDQNGEAQQVATWKSVPERPSQVRATSSWTRDDIAALEIRSETGTPVTRLVT